LALVGAPAEALDGRGVAQALAHECELVESLEAVDEHFVGLSTERHILSAWADLQVHDLVGIGDLCYWLRLVTIPEEDWRARAGCDEFELVVTALAHSHVVTVLRLAHLNTLLLLKIVGAKRTVSAASMNPLWLLLVREDGHDVLLLVRELNQKLARTAVPDTHSAVLSARQYVI